MNTVIGIAIAIGIIVILIVIKNKKPKINQNKNVNLKDVVKKTFPKYKIIEKHGTVMVCEINHRNEPDELVFIRVEANKTKKITQFGRRFKVVYPKIPSSKELKIDFGKYLN